MARFKKDRNEIEEEDSTSAATDKRLASGSVAGDETVQEVREILKANTKATNAHDRTGGRNGPS